MWLHAYLVNSLLAIRNRGLQLPLVLQSLDNILVLPSDLVGDATYSAVFATRCQADGSHGVGSNLLLDPLVAGRNTFEGSEPPQCGASPVWFVGQHSTDSPFEDLGRGSVMEWTACRVDITSFPQETQELQLVPVTQKLLIIVKEWNEIT